ncbi:hypothetical protein HK104_009762 [Borealophlyctis nickersoniae]|nr:hypothetical protein HK104_009762 [Borealophlyctis nickersoniae]
MPSTSPIFAECLRSTPFSGPVLPRSNTEAYTEARRIFNPRITISPAYIVYAHSPQDVQYAVQCAAKCSDIHAVAVRCGGHSYEGLSLGGKESVVVDVAALNGVKVEGSKLVVGGGAKLGCVYGALWKHENGVWQIPAGTCPTVGIAGLATGLTADYITAVTMVDAKGSLVRVTEKDADLFWALRGGGGGNFGIITEFEFQMVKVPDEASAVGMQWGKNDIAEVARAWAGWAPTANSRLTTQLNMIPDGPLLTGKFLGPVADAKSVLSEFLRTVPKPSQSDIFPLSSPILPPDNPDPSNDWICDPTQAKQDLNDKKKSDYVYDEIPPPAFFHAIQDFVSETPESTVQFEAYGGIFASQSPSWTPFPHRGARIKFSLQYWVMWSNAEEEATRLKNLRGFEYRIQEWVSGMKYRNYADLEMGKEWGLRYHGKENWERLKRVKAEVDPSGLFWHEQSIPVNSK